MPAPDTLLAEYDYLSDVARQLRKSERTIVRYTQQPDGLPYIKLGNRMLFRRETTRKWLASLERRPNPTRSRRRLDAAASADAARP
jgi:hypothetical protein